ncbi:hypothetical protein [Nannocystis pusilla]|uniref:hypothetical protein n=1 Tax=Nannocystis pusilla TaxID=889268 RepID=UPI003DA4D9CB
MQSASACGDAVHGSGSPVVGSAVVLLVVGAAVVPPPVVVVVASPPVVEPVGVVAFPPVCPQPRPHTSTSQEIRRRSFIIAARILPRPPQRERVT